MRKIASTGNHGSLHGGQPLHIQPHPRPHGRGIGPPAHQGKREAGARGLIAIKGRGVIESIEHQVQITIGIQIRRGEALMHGRMLGSPSIGHVFELTLA